jgi:hypothetical protein
MDSFKKAGNFYQVSKRFFLLIRYCGNSSSNYFRVLSLVNGGTLINLM